MHGNLDDKNIHNAIEFEKEFMNFCIEFAIDNKKLLSKVHLKSLENFENNGTIINKKINFDIIIPINKEITISPLSKIK